MGRAPALLAQETAGANNSHVSIIAGLPSGTSILFLDGLVGQLPFVFGVENHGPNLGE